MCIYVGFYITKVYKEKYSNKLTYTTWVWNHEHHDAFINDTITPILWAGKPL